MCGRAADAPTDLMGRGHDLCALAIGEGRRAAGPTGPVWRRPDWSRRSGSHSRIALQGVAIGAGPAYLLTRYWAWGKQSKSHLVTEVLPFCGLAFFGLSVSTAATGIANTYSDAQAVLNLVNLASFGLI